MKILFKTIGVALDMNQVIALNCTHSSLNFYLKTGDKLEIASPHLDVAYEEEDHIYNTEDGCNLESYHVIYYNIENRQIALLSNRVKLYPGDLINVFSFAIPNPSNQIVIISRFEDILNFAKTFIPNVEIVGIIIKMCG